MIWRDLRRSISRQGRMDMGCHIGRLPRRENRPAGVARIILLC
jgi:hypothetical protein